MKNFLHNFKNALILSLFIIASFTSFSQTATAPSTGDGTEGNPYEIATLDNLYWLSQTDTEWGKYYVQTANIDATTSSSWESGAGYTPIGNNTTKFSGTYNGKGHVISNLFINRPTEDYIGFFGLNNSTSQIDSLGLTNLNITGRQYVGGLAGSIDQGTVKNCYTNGTVHTAYVNYTTYTGGLIGHNSGIISNCYNNANVSGGSAGHVGGFIGRNAGSNAQILNCYNSGDVTAASAVGGFSGVNETDAIITYCYSSGAVVATGSHTGGFNGYNTGSITKSYWDTEASGFSSSVGGTGLTTTEMKNLVNYLMFGWDFMDEPYNGNEEIWGLNSSENDGYPFLSIQGFTNTEELACQTPLSSPKNIFSEVLSNTIIIDSIQNSGEGNVVYVNTTNTWTVPTDGEEPAVNTTWQNSGQQCIFLGISNIAETTITNLDPNTNYYIKAYAYNDCSGTETYEQTGYGIHVLTKATFTVPTGDGTTENPYIIANLENLAWVMYSDTAWDKHFIQTANIDATETTAWDSGSGFNPIGNETTSFTGSYNGKGYTIDNLYINRTSTKFIGLFGLLDSGSRVDSLGTTNVNITGSQCIGGLTGYNYGIIENCYTTGTVKGTLYHNYVYCGGLAGFNKNKINNCYSTANVTASNGYGVGGLVGFSRYTNGKISNSYSLGNVSGNSMVGGLIGYLYESSSVNNSYSKGNVSASEHYAAGLVGLASSGTSITKCYSTGTASATLGYRGGLIGDKSSSATITHCFWDTQTSGTTSSDGGTGLTTVQMQDIKNYLEAEWDFMNETYNGTNDIWGINSTDNNGYPFLKWQGYASDNFCEAPLSPASNIMLTNSLSESITLESFTDAGYGAEGYAIFMNTEDVWTDPVDDEEPTANTTWQNSGQQCIYFGSSNNPNETIDGLELCSGTYTYYFKIYAYSICSDIKIYENTGVVIIVDGTDTSIPVVDITNLSDLVGQCSVTVSSTPTATDNCAGNITGTTSDPLIYTEQGTYTITWTYDDGNGNITTQQQTVIVDDNTAPVPDIANINVLGQCSVTISSIPTATDNCSGSITGITSDPLSYTEQGTYSITWTYTDVEGNVATQVQTVTVDDNTAPIPDATNLDDVVGQCFVTTIETPTATDNCSGSITGTTSDPLSYTEQGTYAITWTFIDIEGNTTTQNQIVIVEDDTNPNIACVGNQNKEIAASESVYIVSGLEFDPTETTDNCEIASVENDFNNSETLEGAEFPVGSTTVTWTILDVAGNNVECSYDVVVTQTTGINDLSNLGIKMYPNPVNGLLNITCENENIERISVLDITGKTIIDITSISKNERIDMSGYNSGIYFVQIDTGKEIFTSKVIKK